MFLQHPAHNVPRNTERYPAAVLSEARQPHLLQEGQLQLATCRAVTRRRRRLLRSSISFGAFPLTQAIRPAAACSLCAVGAPKILLCARGVYAVRHLLVQIRCLGAAAHGEAEQAVQQRRAALQHKVCLENMLLAPNSSQWFAMHT